MEAEPKCIMVSHFANHRSVPTLRHSEEAAGDFEGGLLCFAHSSSVPR